MSFDPKRWTTKDLEKLFGRQDQPYWGGPTPRRRIELAHFDPYGTRTLKEAEVEEDRTPTCVEGHDNDSESRDSLVLKVAGLGEEKRRLFSEPDLKWRSEIRRTDAGNRWMESR